MEFFSARGGHKIVPSSSLVPENDPSVLFTTAGMQQFKSYYTGIKDAQKDFGSKNTTSIQKSLRTSDIDEVGDERHLTFFEMLGNFSFGGYWKEEAIKYAHEFITKEIGLKIAYVTVFEGEVGVPADQESEQIWKNIDSGVEVKKFGRADNFWGPTGDEGPCGPTTEIYVNGIEIWNIVFNEYYQNPDKTLRPLEIKGIDTGMGLERLAMVSQGVDNIFQTDLFEGRSLRLLKGPSLRAARIVADHIRSAVFLIADGVTPSNTDRGYILRRLLRRAIRYAAGDLKPLAESVIEKYGDIYLNLKSESSKIKREIEQEESKFRETLARGLKEFERGADPFTLFTSYGFPLDLIKELAAEKGQPIDEEKFAEAMKRHQELSRAGAAQKFKGGLADHNPETIKLHTAHHLLLKALQMVLGSEVKQRGSNITSERLRIDFSHSAKLTDDEKRQVEEIVNQKIAEDLPVNRKEMGREEAEKLGAEREFGQKYGEVVSVYFIGDPDLASGQVFSKEFCGGPHIARTGELGHFKIVKEEAVAAGVRRIKAVLE